MPKIKAISVYGLFDFVNAQLTTHHHAHAERIKPNQLSSHPLRLSAIYRQRADMCHEVVEKMSVVIIGKIEHFKMICTLGKFGKKYKVTSGNLKMVHQFLHWYFDLL